MLTAEMKDQFIRRRPNSMEVLETIFDHLSEVGDHKTLAQKRNMLHTMVDDLCDEFAQWLNSAEV